MNDMVLRNSSMPEPRATRCLRFRRRILDISQQVGALHIGSAYSCTEIVDCIYHGLMRRFPDGKSPDTFLMSKGHGCMIQYVILEEMGVLSRRDLDLYCKAEGRLGCHPDYGNPGIEASTGSLGHGLSMLGGHGAGRARPQDRRRHLHGAERRRGAGGLDLGGDDDGLLARLLQSRRLRRQQRFPEPRPHVRDAPLLLSAQRRSSRRSAGKRPRSTATTPRPCSTPSPAASGDKPFMVVGKTTKGKGISYMENVPIWHYRSPSKEEYEQAVIELEQAAS